MSLPEEEDSILQKSVIPNLLEEEFNPALPTGMCDEIISRENLNNANPTSKDENMDNEVTSYKRKQFKDGVDFRKTLGSFCKKQIN